MHEGASDQLDGYAIAKKPSVLIPEYDQSLIEKGDQDYLHSLRRATDFFDPASYAGVGRDCLEPLPSLSDEELRTFHGARNILVTEIAAGRRIGELGGDQPDVYDLYLLQRLDHVREVFGLLKAPQDFEVIHISRRSLTWSNATLGFDVGWWATSYSVICDSAVMPTWHGPEPEEHDAVAGQLRAVNEHVLFENPKDAERFRTWYSSQEWAETNGFAVIRVNRVDL